MSQDTLITGSSTFLNIGETFTITAPSGGPVKGDIQLNLYLQGSSSVLQYVFFHASCSQPLNVDDRYGLLTLVEFINGNGQTVADANCAPGPTATPPPPPPPGVCVPPVTPSTYCDVCAVGSGPTAKLEYLALEYVGFSAAVHAQDSNMVTVDPDYAYNGAAVSVSQ